MLQFYDQFFIEQGAEEQNKLKVSTPTTIEFILIDTDRLISERPYGVIQSADTLL